MSRTLTLGLLALGILCLMCLWCHAPRLEADIRSRVAGELHHLGATSLADTSRVEGCVVTLQGEISSETARDNAAQQVSTLDGVCRVVDEVTIATQRSATERVDPPRPSVSGGEATATTTAATTTAATTTTETAPGEPTSPPIALYIDRRHERTILRGTVADEATRARLLATAQSVFAPDTVVDQLSNASGEQDPRLPSTDALLRVLARRDEDVTVGVARDRAEVDGSVLSELARRRLLGAIGAALPGLRIVDQLEERAPTSETETLQANLDQVLAGKRVAFESGSDQLTARGRAVLDELAASIGVLTGRLEIAGHTDSQGDEAFNQNLSEQRAEAVKRYLGERGLETRWMTASGFGESRPIATNDTAEGRQQNRRTELRALEQEKE